MGDKNLIRVGEGKQAGNAPLSAASPRTIRAGV